MIRSLSLSIISIVSELMFILHPLPNKTINAIVCTALLMLHAVMLGIACYKEQQLKDRIQMLEDKSENNADNIHWLMKKQSGKIIEYSIGE